ncbi:hypothetical protein AVEN_84566-1 [Araneus ventricosus]|uniref:Uncharacterized protein n=1 Tax=Araneus ventricosus TaxID=182803 RepID=A0A4Y2C2S1_ARAVE|nr:hypothetical protein AVEN_84566-1 [Araneus ventricosus]
MVNGVVTKRKRRILCVNVFITDVIHLGRTGHLYLQMSIDDSLMSLKISHVLMSTDMICSVKSFDTSPGHDLEIEYDTGERNSTDQDLVNVQGNSKEITPPLRYI